MKILFKFRQGAKESTFYSYSAKNERGQEPLLLGIAVPQPSLRLRVPIFKSELKIVNNSDSTR